MTHQSPHARTMKRRADTLLIERGLAADAHEAEALILAGKVRAGAARETVIDASGTMLAVDTPLSVKAPARYVSRGGLKLEGALRDFTLDVTGLRCVDLGASTGGFTDCLLQQGAAHVVAIDVGYGQLAEKLRTNERVTVVDRTNIRDLTVGDIAGLGGPFDLVVADLSFIGLSTVAGDIARFMAPPPRTPAATLTTPTTVPRARAATPAPTHDITSTAILLVKPQFEVARTEVEPGGVVTDPQAHERALARATEALEAAGLNVPATTTSPITGSSSGNTEFFIMSTSGKLNTLCG
ncbi:MAG: TlyA family RNA methyltransferase [Coriobacteriia bacterium]|nr:TlyA family RNA methyltransferase [Coriobacteriia bacterium]